MSRVTQPSLLAWEALGHRVLLGLADAFKGCDECPSPARAPSPPRHLLPTPTPLKAIPSWARHHRQVWLGLEEGEETSDSQKETGFFQKAQK